MTDKKGEPATSVPRTAFKVYDGNVVREISSLSDDNAPSSVAFVFDILPATSSKDRAVRAQRTTDAIARFVRSNKDTNEYFLMTIAKRPLLLLDSTRNPDTVINALSQFGTSPLPTGSAIFDTLGLAVQKVSQGTYEKKVVVLITDGFDQDSRTSYKDTIRLLKEKNVLVYTLFLLPEAYVGHEDDLLRDTGTFGEIRSILKGYASFTGGRLFHVSKDTQLEDILGAITRELQHQYTIELQPSQVASGKCHSFKIKLTEEYKSLSVRVRESLCE